MCPHKDHISSMQKALQDVGNQMQVMQYRYEVAPPLNRSEILATARRKLGDLDILVGRKNGSNVFHLALIDVAAYLTFAASACADKSVGIE